LLHSHTQFIVKLETQVGQLAEAITRREHGALPSQAWGESGTVNIQSSNQLLSLIGHTTNREEN